MASNLLLVATVDLAAAGAFVLVGERLRRRQVSGPEKRAQAASVLWWWGMGTYMAMQAALALPAAFGAASPAVSQAAQVLSGPLLGAAAWGLSFHILYLFSGRRGLAWPLAAYYLLAASAYTWFAGAYPITAVAPSDWEIAATRDQPWPEPWRTVVLAAIGFPLVLSSLGYLGLAAKVETRVHRYRVLLVGSSILLWVVAGFGGQVGGGPFMRFFTIVGLGLLASLAVFIAYFPPARLRRWLEADAPSPAS